MRRLFALALALAVLRPAAAEEAKRPNTLSPRQVAEGWILLFDGESTFGWRSPNGSKWHVYDGTLYPERDQLPGALVTTTAFADYELRFHYLSRPDTQAEIRVGCDADGNAGVPGMRL